VGRGGGAGLLAADDSGGDMGLEVGLVTGTFVGLLYRVVSCEEVLSLAVQSAAAAAEKELLSTSSVAMAACLSTSSSSTGEMILSVEGLGDDRCSTRISYLAGPSLVLGMAEGNVMLRARFCMKARRLFDPEVEEFLLSMSDVERFLLSFDLEKAPLNKPLIRPCLYSTVSSFSSSSSSSLSLLVLLSWLSALIAVSTRGNRAWLGLEALLLSSFPPGIGSTFGDDVDDKGEDFAFSTNCLQSSLPLSVFRTYTARPAQANTGKMVRQMMIKMVKPEVASGWLAGPLSGLPPRPLPRQSGWP
jgi:hypothetical protein